MSLLHAPNLFNAYLKKIITWYYTNIKCRRIFMYTIMLQHFISYQIKTNYCLIIRLVFVIHNGMQKKFKLIYNWIIIQYHFKKEIALKVFWHPSFVWRVNIYSNRKFVFYLQEKYLFCLNYLTISLRKNCQTSSWICLLNSCNIFTLE